MTLKLDLRFFLMLFLALSIVACKEDEDDHDHDDNDEELITTVELTFTADGSTLVYSWTDADGEGGNDPVIEDITLAANTTYQLSTRVLNESEDPAEDITEEVAEEDLDHLFIYTVTGANMEVSITDTDSAGDPLGLTAEVVVGDASTGSLQVVLKHESDKASPATTGETDIEVDFGVTVE